MERAFNFLINGSGLLQIHVIERVNQRLSEITYTAIVMLNAT